MAISNQHFIERTSCPCCLSSDSEVAYECPFDADPIKQYLLDYYAPYGGVQFDYLRGASYVLRQCRDCTLIFQTQVGNEALQELLYEEWIDAALAKERDNRKSDLKYHVEHATEIITVLAQLGKLPADARVFDFGMGWARWCRMAKGFGCHVFGTELSEERKKFAKSQGISVISWDEIPGQHFDFINTEQVLEHIPEPLDTLKHLVSGLSDDGLIKISVPNGKRIPALLKQPVWIPPKGRPNRLNPVAPLEHINCFNHRSLVKLGSEANLTLVQPDWDTHVDVTSSKRGLRGLRRRLGQLRRALKAFVGLNSSRQSGTYLFFRKS